MNRNSNSVFSRVPTIDIPRSRQPVNFDFCTTFNAGKLVPIMYKEVLPGDTWSLDASILCRMNTPLFPVMGNASLSTFYFFVPNRLVWNHWKEFMGENNESAWADTENVYTIPQITAPAGGTQRDGWSYGGVCDNFGVRPGVMGIQHSALPLRAYRLIWNEWFRAQALQAPKLIDFGDTESMNGYENIDYDKENDLDALLPVNKPFDYFTAALPAPQRGPAVLIPISWSEPVAVYSSATSRTQGLGVSGGDITNTYNLNAGTSAVGYLTTRDSTGAVKVTYDSSLSGGAATFSPSNLVASKTQLNSGVGTIDELRAAFQIQKLLWRDGVGGGRYTELLKSHFSVNAPDASLQRPEYLGGDHVYITMNQVVQTSSTDGTSPLGSTGAVSKTVSKKHVIEKSFTEHGMIIGLACVRTEHSYQQGIDRSWLRKTRLDYYTPEFDNLGDQPIYNKEIFFQRWGAAENDEVFGYNEAWADYRYHRNIVAGAFRNDYPGGSLSAWTYADFYDDMPYLSDEWIQETDENINRTIAVQSDLADQFRLNIFHSGYADRPMSMHSTPGLADHF